MSESQKVALKGVLFQLVSRTLFKMCVPCGSDGNIEIPSPVPNSKKTNLKALMKSVEFQIVILSIINEVNNSTNN